MKWRGNYKLDHPASKRHGQTGSVEDVEASSQKDAEEAMQRAAAMKMFGNSMMYEYFDVSDLVKVAE